MKQKDKVKRFDFRRRPIKHAWLSPVAKGILSFPDLKKRGAVIRKHNMEDIEDKPSKPT